MGDPVPWMPWVIQRLSYQGFVHHDDFVTIWALVRALGRSNPPDAAGASDDRPFSAFVDGGSALDRTFPNFLVVAAEPA